MATYPIKLQNGDDTLLPITYAGLVQINDNGTIKSLSKAWNDHKRFVINFQIGTNEVIPDKTYQETYDAFSRGAEIYGNIYVGDDATIGSYYNINGYFSVALGGFVFDVINLVTGPVIMEIVYKSDGSIESYEKPITDTNVTVFSTSTNANYPLIFKLNNHNNTETAGLRYDSDGTINSYYNPGKNTLYAKYSYATEFTENGATLSSKYAAVSHIDTKASTTAYGHVIVDSSLSSTSTNPIQNKVINTHVTTNASTTTYGHVKVDDTLNNTSTNPVQNKVIYTKMIENEQTTAIGLAVLNSRLETVEATSSQISNYIPKSGTNKVANSQEIHWSERPGNKDGLHITNSSIGWTGGDVAIEEQGPEVLQTYGSAIFSRSGISIDDNINTTSGLHFNVSASGSYTYVIVGGNNKISLESDGTTGRIVAPKFLENSDERLKTDIENIASIDEINMYEFNVNGSHMYGFVAQDLEKTHPELVTTSSEDSGEIHNVKSVDYNSSLALVVSKLINKITELEERIKELEKK